VWGIRVDFRRGFAQPSPLEVPALEKTATSQSAGTGTMSVYRMHTGPHDCINTAGPTTCDHRARRELLPARIERESAYPGRPERESAYPLLSFLGARARTTSDSPGFSYEHASQFAPPPISPQYTANRSKACCLVGWYSELFRFTIISQLLTMFKCSSQPPFFWRFFSAEPPCIALTRAKAELLLKVVYP
jgi:hypothetical protein